VDESPNLIDLDLFRIQTPDFGVQQPGALLASRFEDAQHCAPVKPCKAFASPDAHSLGQHADDVESLFRVNPKIVQRTGGNIAKRLAALFADVPLIRLPIDSEFNR
jgi:hypothetical protein